MKKHLLFTLVAAVVICMIMTVTAFADSTPINIGDTVKCTMTENGGDANVFEYSLTLPKSGDLEIDINSNIDYSIGYSLSGEGFTISVSSSKGCSDTEGFIRKGETDLEYELAAGEYILRFDGANSKPGDITFTTEFDPAKETYTKDNNSVNVIRNSDALKFNKKIYGHIALNDTEDWYKVDLPASGKLSIAVDSDIDKIYFLMDDANKQFISDKFIGEGNETIELELAKGIYFMHFGQADDYGKYNFKLNFKDADETYQFENETINLVREKKSIPFATTIKGHFAINDTEDCFKVYAPKAGKYSIKVTSSMDSTTLRVRDKKDQYIEDYYHNKGTKTYTVKLKKGNNYLLFDGGGNNYGNYSFKVKPAKVSIKKLTKATKAFKATWSKGTGDGYQLQYSTDKNFKKNVKSKTVSSIKTTSRTIKSLKSKKTYYVRIRTYVKDSDGDKIWSDWSKAKTVKTR